MQYGASLSLYQYTTLSEAIKRKSQNTRLTIDYLIGLGAPVTTCNKSVCVLGFYMCVDDFIIACQCRDLTTAKYLIDKGVDIHGKNNINGVTPLSTILLMEGKTEVADFIIQNGGKISNDYQLIQIKQYIIYYCIEYHIVWSL